MIVRISGENQYRLPDSDREGLEKLESKVVELLDSGREDGFEDSFSAVLDFVRANGTPVGDDELEGSDVILPPSDVTFQEATGEFTGEGLIPD